MNTRLPTVLCLIAAFLAQPAASALPHSGVREWRFNVLLDGKPIGYHHFQLNKFGSDRDLDKELSLRSEARFSVKFLFVTAYRYVHDAHEVWREGCLDRISASTDDGARSVVSGSQEMKRFLFTSGQQPIAVECVLTFAYWSPQILTATYLLNPQTGEHVPVRVTHLGNESIAVRGTQRRTDRYRIEGDARAGKLIIDLWYSADKEWLALESKTAQGHTLRYQLK